MTTGLPYLGETLALLTAVAWGFAVILFKKSGETVHPIGLNLFKNTLATILFLPTIYLAGETLFHPAPAEEYIYLMISGALGIGLADTLFFKCLNTLGAGLTAIVDCLYSPFIIIASVFWLHESLTPLQVLGAVMIVSAVLTATRPGGAGRLSRRDLFWGLAWGVMAMATQALGVVMAKPILDRSPLFWVTEVRLIGGFLSLAVILVFHTRRRQILASLSPKLGWKHILWGSFIGTYIALGLWLAGMKYTQASIAAALNQTSNIFIFIFAALFLREPITRARTVGILLAVAGSVLVTFAW